MHPQELMLRKKHIDDRACGPIVLVGRSGSGRCGLVLHCGRKFVRGYLPRSPLSLHPYKNDRGLAGRGRALANGISNFPPVVGKAVIQLALL
ncbi:MAG: hypothetical protein AB4352_27365 [Hormoscilla sp.]